MARITSQKAIQAIGNKYDMILIAASRARELRRGSTPKVSKLNGPCITALREIEEGHIDMDYYMKRNIKSKIK